MQNLASSAHERSGILTGRAEPQRWFPPALLGGLVCFGGESEALLLNHIMLCQPMAEAKKKEAGRCEQRKPVEKEKRVSPLSRVGESQDGEEHGQAKLLTEGKTSLEAKASYQQLRFPFPVSPPAQCEFSTSRSLEPER